MDSGIPQIAIPSSLRGNRSARERKALETAGREWGLEGDGSDGLSRGDSIFNGSMVFIDPHICCI